ncbi:MAG: holo-ACP synthase [Dehalococcoidia bacterium]|nr:holo-ACP synthase [Dehalococcoidia bacterium]MDW8120368.1 holo-ACP synthase [Chloroflexota bacterium]
MLYIGVDIIEIPRIARAVERWGERFLTRIYTPQELSYARGQAPQLATRFAAKEAVMKALGTGIRGVSWTEIEVVRERGQPPTIRLTGRALARAHHLGIRRFALSLSHSRDLAIAVVIGETTPAGEHTPILALPLTP